MSNGAPEPFEGEIERPFGTEAGDARRLAIGGLALSIGIVWGASILLVGLIATARGVEDGSWYGQDFLLAVAALYPGYGGQPLLLDSLVGGLIAFVDGAVGGALVAWLYNRFTLGGGRPRA